MCRLVCADKHVMLVPFMRPSGKCITKVTPFDPPCDLTALLIHGHPSCEVSGWVDLKALNARDAVNDAVKSLTVP